MLDRGAFRSKFSLFDGLVVVALGRCVDAAGSRAHRRWLVPTTRSWTLPGAGFPPLTSPCIDIIRHNKTNSRDIVGGDVVRLGMCEDHL